MSNWANIKDGKVVAVWDLLPQSWNNVSNFDCLESDESTLKTHGWFKVIRDNRAHDELTERLGDSTYEIFNEVVYEVIPRLPLPQPMSTEQHPVIAWANVRMRRDILMKNFEWRYERYNREVRLGLTPTDDIAALDTYMQALANITTQQDVYTITWPTF